MWTRRSLIVPSVGTSTADSTGWPSSGIVRAPDGASKTATGPGMPVPTVKLTLPWVPLFSATENRSGTPQSRLAGTWAWNGVASKAESPTGIVVEPGELVEVNGSAVGSVVTPLVLDESTPDRPRERRRPGVLHGLAERHVVAGGDQRPAAGPLRVHADVADVGQRRRREQPEDQEGGGAGPSDANRGEHASRGSAGVRPVVSVQGSPGRTSASRARASGDAGGRLFAVAAARGLRVVAGQHTARPLAPRAGHRRGRAAQA